MSYEFADGYVPQSIFRSCADLDGTAAAAFLAENGARVIGHKDQRTNGIALGVLSDGRYAALSTNGHMTICASRADLERRLPRTYDMLLDIEAAAGEFSIA